MFKLTFAIIRQIKGLAVLAAVLGALASPTLSQAESKELTLPLFKFHPLFGTWWAQTLYDEEGEVIWEGGQNDERVMMRVDISGSYASRMECNALVGTFQEPGEDGSVTISPEGSMTTLMGCFGEFPPTIPFYRIARYEREGLELRFYDADDLPVAVFYDVYAMKRMLDDILGS